MRDRCLSFEGYQTYPVQKKIKKNLIIRDTIADLRKELNYSYVSRNLMYLVTQLKSSELGSVLSPNCFV